MDWDSRIVISKSFWITAVLASQELYQYWEQDKESRDSGECLGVVLGQHSGSDYQAECGVVIQRIKERTNKVVKPYSLFDQLLHSLWAVADATGLTILGMFHSHPWTEAERYDYKLLDGTEAQWSGPSGGDLKVMAPSFIEIIVSVKAIEPVPEENHDWMSRGLELSGRLDQTHITMSGWLKKSDKDVEQLPIHFPASSEINTRINRGYDHPVSGRSINFEALLETLRKLKLAD